MSNEFMRGFLAAQEDLEKVGESDATTKALGVGALLGLPAGVGQLRMVQRLKRKKHLTRKGYVRALKKLKGGAPYKALAAAGVLSLLSGIGATVRLRQAAAAKHGKGWKEKIRGKPGSFTPRHPILSNFLGGIPGVSALRAGGKVFGKADTALAEKARKEAERSRSGFALVRR